jgi:hypothetical protein
MQIKAMLKKLWLLLFIVACFRPLAHADIALLLEEPYGMFGSMNPTGHAAVYLPEVCADTPTHLRRCRPGEGGGGIVISRYDKIGGYDWVAIPLIPYLYAVDTIDEIPHSANKELVAELRDDYRREHLLDLVPDAPHGRTPKGQWVQLVGAAYIRKIYGFRINTTQEQDDAFIQYLNEDRANKVKFNLVYSNCADFAREVMNFYEPHSIHRNFLADAGITTPKQVARSLASYAHRHPKLELSSFQISQVPGSIKRSKSPDGVAEALLKSKKYVVPLALLSPYTAVGVGVAYFTGRFDPKKNVEQFDLAQAVQPQPRNVPVNVNVNAWAIPDLGSVNYPNRITAFTSVEVPADGTR